MEVRSTDAQRSTIGSRALEAFITLGMAAWQMFPHVIHLMQPRFHWFVNLLMFWKARALFLIRPISLANVVEVRSCLAILVDLVDV